ncbi:MAG: hypothetical protein RTU30_02765 [Candidatus Thorarchaeota archaeon]
MKYRHTLGCVLILLACWTIVPPVSAEMDFGLRYSVSEGDRVYYQWTGNCTRPSRNAIYLDHIVYIEITGVSDYLVSYRLYFENGTEIGYNAVGWHGIYARPGIELSAPAGVPLTPFPVGNWTYFSSMYENSTNTDVTEDVLTWSISHSFESIRYYQRTYSKTDGIVHYLNEISIVSDLNASYYYELVRITDWTFTVIIGTVAFSGILIAIIFLYRRRRT